ncbi:hypothetical protein C8F01DRAFT_1233609 [Mycena amicta]|nr:hypothetical protein C8F01DRAFT_1233609 [Mycena amicta]
MSIALPVPQQVQGSVPPETDLYIAAQWPHLSEQGRVKLFEDTVTAFGGKQHGLMSAFAYFKNAHDVRALGVTPLGPSRPPANAVLRETRIGDTQLAVFFHPTYPPAIQHLGPLLWTFYIGLYGHGEGSIMLEADRAARGIRLFTPNLQDEWEEFKLFQVTSSTPVRVQYALDFANSPGSDCGFVEIVFPAVPAQQGAIPVQQL